MWILFLLIFISALPVFAAALWFRFCKFKFPKAYFLLSLLLGAISVFIAALFQYFIPSKNFGGIYDLLVNVYVRIALTEEGSRLIVLLPFFWFLRRFGKPGDTFMMYGADRIDTANLAVTEDSSLKGAAIGLITGLGFALVENASYGTADLHLALLRSFTAAPLHGACGSRVGLALTSKEQGLRHFFSAVLIHGTYNILVVSQGNLRLLSILLSYSTLIFSMRLIKKGE